MEKRSRTRVFVVRTGREAGPSTLNQVEMADDAKTETGARPRIKPTRQMENLAKKASKKHAKMELKDKRTFDNIMKSIGNVSAEEKFNILANKYKSLYDEIRQLEITQIKYHQLQLENEHLNHEFGKNLLARNRLENLCRELQKQNREVKEEAAAIIREEEDKRKQVSNRFQHTFDELTGMLEQSNKNSLQLRDDNVDMVGRVEMLAERSQQLEEQMDLMKREMDLERQLCQSNMAKTKLEAQMEKEQWEQERKAIELNLKKSEEVRLQLQENGRVQQEQIRLYVAKCSEFEKTVHRSNKMFEKCRSEMQTLTRKLAEMEAEAKTWKLEWLKRDEEAEMGKRKIVQLERLCRYLQAERNTYLKYLRAYNIEVPSVSVPDTQDQIDLSVSSVETVKEEKLVALKNQLAVLKIDLKKAQTEEGEADAKEEAVIEEADSADLVENGDVPSSSSTVAGEVNNVAPETTSKVEENSEETVPVLENAPEETELGRQD